MTTTDGAETIVTQLVGAASDKASEIDEKPLVRLLTAIGIKGTDEDTNASDGPAAAFKGSTQSVAVIEATATAACKWWSAGLGVTVAGLWGGIFAWWNGQSPATQRVALWMAAIVTAAAVFGVAYLLGSDVKGRASASVATIRARAQVGDTALAAAQAMLPPPPAATPAAATPESSSASSAAAPLASSPAPQAQLVALAPPIEVNLIPRPSAEEPGWKAIALLSNGDDVNKYFVVKGDEHDWADASEVSLAV
ncbi:MAG: hypothetical protein JO016_05710 [Actinobacteria bacterium]|nr:hypothetical protein [Actinomycetota bacterium]